jgi:hypothetical protein
MRKGIFSLVLVFLFFLCSDSSSLVSGDKSTKRSFEESFSGFKVQEAVNDVQEVSISKEGVSVHVSGSQLKRSKAPVGLEEPIYRVLDEDGNVIYIF